MAQGLHGVGTPKIITKSISLSAATTTEEIDLLGGTLLGVHIPELTSTSFTITTSATSGGTFATLKDGLGQFTTAGNPLSFTIGATSFGYFPIPHDMTIGLRFVKLVFSSSETATISVVYRSVE